MEEQDLKSIWKQSSKKQEINMNIEQLIGQFKTGMQQREKIVRHRDRREIVTAIIIMVFLSLMVLDFLWAPVTIGLLVTLAAFANFIYKLRSNRKSKFTQELFMPIKKQLHLQRLFMVSQAKLLSTVLYWAALPIFTGYMLVIWSIWDIEAYDVSSAIRMLYPSDLNDKVMMTIVTLFSLIYMVRLNKKAARVNWQPLINQIDLVIESLEEEDGN